jgi:hypothetical protein
MMKRLLLLALLAAAAQAHVGNPDIYFEGPAGPYRLFVTVRPPLVIPGVAEVEVRSHTADVRELHVVPLPLTGAGAQFAPVADKLAASPQDPQFFTGSVWLMAHGSWQVRITADGTKGTGILAVPLPSVAHTVKKMDLGLGGLLGALGLFLAVGLIGMTTSGIREATLEPGTKPGENDKRRAKIGLAVAVIMVAAIVWGGNAWWSSEAATFDARVYKPLEMRATLGPDRVLTLKMKEPGWMSAPRPGTLTRILFVRKMDDLIPDHNHLMHLYALREPGLDVVYHLHPELAETGSFRLRLPSMPAGTYKLYGDIVHANGFAETMVTSVELPAIIGRALAGDDAVGSTKPWTKAAFGSTSFTLPDGYRMEWLRAKSPPHANEASLFRFRLLTPDGRAPKDMAFYMGMLGHAAFVKTDGTAFAHIHPDGSASMAALRLTGDQMEMPGMKMHAELPNEVDFPYGFPARGRYRIIVQMKHGETVETGIFDADVT